MSERSPHVVIRAWDEQLGKETLVHVSYGALKTIDPQHYHIHRGEAYGYSNKHTLPASGSYLAFLFQVGSVENEHFTGYGVNATGGPTDLWLYENPFFDVNSLGTDITSQWQNHKRSMAVGSYDVVTTRLNPFFDVNSLGTRLDYAQNPNTSGGPLTPGAGEAQGLANEWMMKPGSTYLMYIANRSISAETAGVTFTEYDNPY